MTSNSSGPPRAPAIDVHAHIIVPEVYAVAAEHNVFSELPTDPGVTDEMRQKIKDRAGMVLGRMSDVEERLAKMDAMGVDVQVLSASLVHQGLEWADAQTSLKLARTTNDWIAKAVAARQARFIGLGTLPLHVPSLAVSELERCVRELGFKGAAASRRGRLATQHGCWLCSALSGPKVPQHGRRDDGRTAAQSHFHL